MKGQEIGLAIAKARLAAGMSQAELASRMETTQSAISRAESGAVTPSIDFIDRAARATGRPIVLTLGSDVRRPVSRATRRRRARRILGGYRFDPYGRTPSSAEERSLKADGITRDRFQGARSS